MTKKKREHYVDNKLFLAEMIKFRDSVIEAKENKLERPLVPFYIGECIMKIAVRFSHKPNFMNYSYKGEMIGGGIENCLHYIDNFDPSKGSNPFAYFTQIIFFAFLRRIEKEKKEQYTRHKLTQNIEVMNMSSENQGHDTNDYRQGRTSEWSQEHVDEFIESFEKKRMKNKS